MVTKINDTGADQKQAKWRSALVAGLACLAILPVAGAKGATVADPPAAYATLLTPGKKPGTPGKKRKKEEEDALETPAQEESLSNAMQAAAQVDPPDPSLAGRMDAKKWQPALEKAMHDAHITTPDQQAAFLAQVDEESDGLALVNELPWGLDRSEWNDQAAVRDYFDQKYANMDGNSGPDSGDGYNYRGRGILQITGKTNYAAVSQRLYGDDRLVKHPELVSQPDVAAAAAAAYWNENNLNRFIPAGQPVTADEFQDLGSTINTGEPGNVPHNADQRVQYWEVTKKALGARS